MFFFVFASRRRHTRCALVTGVQTCALPICRGLGDVLGALASLGYDAEWDCIPAAIIGSPHIRDRAWILAYPNKGRRRANTAAGNNAHGHNTCRTEADGIVGAIPRPSSEWYLADPDAAHDYSERRRQY